MEFELGFKGPFWVEISSNGKGHKCGENKLFYIGCEDEEPK